MNFILFLGIFLVYFTFGIANAKSEVNQSGTDSDISLRLSSLAGIHNHSHENPLAQDQNWRYINNGTGLVPIVKSELVLECSSSSPIEWNITGYIKEPEIIKIQPYKRIYSEKPSYFLKVIVFFLELDSGSSSTFACQRIGQSDDRKYVEVFYPGKTLLVHSDKQLTISDSNIIPCPTTDPTIPVELFKKSPNGSDSELLEKVSDSFGVEYNPVVGFTLPQAAEGTFICNTTTDCVIVEAKLSQHDIQDGYDFYPKKSTIKVFASEQVLLVCSSSKTNISIWVDEVASNVKSLEKVNVTARRNGRLVASLVLSSKNGAPLSLSAGCLDLETGLTVTNWTIELVQAPQLHLDNFEGEVACLSDYEDKSISTVRCINPGHCEYIKHCFESPEMCNFKRQKHFHSSYDTVCWVEKLQGGRNCSFLPYYHLNGVVQCKAQGLSKNWMFFSGLNLRRYSDWRDAPEEALIKLQLRNNGNNRVAVCQAASFLFADSLRFSYVFVNGTEEFVSSEKTKILASESTEKMDELNVAAKIQVPENAIKIRCYAPWWNSTESLSTEIRLDKGTCN